MEEEFYQCLSGAIVTLLGTDRLFTYDFLTAELHMSKTILSGLKNGKDLRLHHYLHVIRFVTDMIHMVIYMVLLFKLIRMVLVNHMDMVIGVVPHKKHGDGKPEEWVVIVEWNE